jgi:hypothetical protein
MSPQYFAFFAPFVWTSAALAGPTELSASAYGVRAKFHEGALSYVVCEEAVCSPELMASVGKGVVSTPTKAAFTSINLGTQHKALHFYAEDAEARYDALFVEGALVFESETAKGTSLRFEPGPANTKLAVRSNHSPAVRLCGEPSAPFGTEAFNPKTLTWVRSTMQRLSKERVKKAIALRAEDVPGNGAMLLTATATSDGPGEGTALTDGDAKTSWTEQRAGEGRGEFVTLEGKAPVTGLAFRAAQETPAKRIFISTNTELFNVEFNGEQRAVVRFPTPIDASCISIVLEQAAESTAAKVGFAEIEAIGKFDTVPRAELVARLEQESLDPELWDSLQRADAETVDALATQIPRLGSRGKARAMELALIHPSTCRGPLLQALWADSDKDISSRARARVERCTLGAKRSEPHPLLVQALRDPRTARDAAGLLAIISPREALEYLSERANDVLVRGALAKAIERTDSAETLTRAYAKVAGTDREIAFLVAAGAKVTELPEGALDRLEQAVVREPFEAKYMALVPLAVHASVGSSRAINRLKNVMHTCARGESQCYEPALRARAIEVSRNIGALTDAIDKTAWDDNPRVRLEFARSTHQPSLLLLLLGDPWSFVREGAVEALAGVPAAEVTDRKLGEILHTDPHRDVRMKAAMVLGKHKAGGTKLAASLETEEEDPEVRMEAARALGVACSREHAELLTKIARGQGSAAGPYWPLQAAAIEALGHLHPPDLADRLAPLGKRPEVAIRAAVQAAVAQQTVCR